MQPANDKWGIYCKTYIKRKEKDSDPAMSELWTVNCMLREKKHTQKALEKSKIYYRKQTEISIVATGGGQGLYQGFLRVLTHWDEL